MRTPPGVWSWWETLAIGVAVTLLVGALTLVNTDMSAEEFGRSAAVLCHTLALASSVLLYLHWRMTGGGPLSWLILGTAALSVHALAMGGLVAGDPQRVEDRPGMVLLTHVVIAVGFLVLIPLARRRAVPDPLMAGVALGATLFVVRDLVLALAPHLNLHTDGLDRLALVALLTDLTVAVGIAAFPRAARWVRYRIAAAVVVTSVANAIAYPVPVNRGEQIPLFVAGHALGATIMLSLAIALVRLSIRDNRASIRRLRDQVLRSEAVSRHDKAQLHEVRSTIAGIASASQIVCSHRSLGPDRRASMNDMIAAEIARLERLTAHSGDDRCTEVDLDTTVEPVVARLAAQGHAVTWVRTGDRAIGRTDDIAEIVSILLDNAVRHAGGQGMVLRTRTTGHWTEVTVGDRGPGVPAGLRDHVFDWGRSGEASAGEGIGLHVARELSEELGGSLELLDSTDVGTTFLLRLPAAGAVTS